MIRKTSVHGTLNLISNVDNYLTEKTREKYHNETEWFNVFLSQVTNRIEEDIFFPLYCSDNGAPNAPIRVMFAMLVLKERAGWSYDALQENSLGNIFVRRALGLFNFDDIVPCRATIFNFLKRLREYEIETGEDLFKKAYEAVTQGQILEFNVMGNKTRMDSALIGSNIKWLSRFELIYETLRYAYSKTKIELIGLLTESELETLKEMAGERSDAVSYRSTTPELKSKIESFGPLYHKIIKVMQESKNEAIETLRKVFDQQYEVVGDSVNPLPAEKIKASSIQSPHDTDCHFNRKNDQEVKGYTANIIETNNPDNLVNLITSATIAPASTHDSKLFMEAIEDTERVTGQQIKTVNTDATYHSASNQEACKNKGIDHIKSALTCNKIFYDYIFDENGDLIATELSTGETFKCEKVKHKKDSTKTTWYFNNSKGRRIEVTEGNINYRYLLRELKSRNKEEINLRNNVEATIHQVKYYLRGGKTLYRKNFRQKIWVMGRCMGINNNRITKYLKDYKELLRTYVELLITLVRAGVSLAFLLNISSFLFKLSYKMLFVLGVTQIIDGISLIFGKKRYNLGF